MPARLPRFVTWGLLAIALTSFGVGIVWESFYLDSLQEHPYLVNVLSGMTGFATSALVITLGVNYFLKRDRVRHWFDVMDEAASNLQWDIESIASRFLGREEMLERSRFHGFQNTSRELVSALSAAKDGSLPEAVMAMMVDHARVDIQHMMKISLPEFERAFEMIGDPGIANALSRIRRGQVRALGDDFLDESEEVLRGLLNVVETICNDRTYVMYEIARRRRDGTEQELRRDLAHAIRRRELLLRQKP